MLQLEDYTTKDIVDYLVNEISEEKSVSKTMAKKLLLNALSYNLVIEEIKNQVDYIMEG